jgi:hypothetical protein
LRALPIAIGEPGFKLDISAFDIAEPGQALAKKFDLALPRRRLPAHKAELCGLGLLRAPRAARLLNQ